MKNCTENKSCVSIKTIFFDAMMVFLIIGFVAFGLSFLESKMNNRLVSFTSGVFGAKTAYAATTIKKDYSALPVLVSGNGKINIPPGQSKQFSIQFQNTGLKTWQNTGKGYVSVYTYGPKYRKSVFQDKSWVSAKQPAKLTEAKVTPSKTGQIIFTLKAPVTKGTYTETFYLAAEDITWINGGQFTVTISVEDPPKEVVAAPAPEAAKINSDLAATVLLRSNKQVTVAGGAAVSYTVGVKNSGIIPWNKREIRVPDIQIASSSVDTQNNSWVSPTQLIVKSDGTVAPGALDLLTFTFNAPRTAGVHTVRYVLAVDDKVVPDFFIDIPVEVTSSAPDILERPIITEEIPVTDLMPEPTIRIGVLIVDQETSWQVEIVCDSDWELRDGTTALLAELKSGEKVTAFYKNSKYWYNRGQGLETTSNYLRFVPLIANTPCHVLNFDRTVTRNSDYPDNSFRNILELRYNDYKDRTWLINELPMEMYLKGLGETSNSSAFEYQKALLTAARTFAFYHWEHNTKRVKEFFHITGYADDQVYRGYDHEMRSPNIVRAAEESRGAIVTYQGRLALTPYFSRSDGRTRDWSEVWYGTVDWLKSVPTPCDQRKGRQLWGHGVGMSATEALCMAGEQGMNWTSILKYFYTGTEVTRRW